MANNRKVWALFSNNKNISVEERIQILEAKVNIMLSLNIAMFVAVFSLLLTKVL